MQITNVKELYEAFNAAAVARMSEDLSMTFVRLSITESQAEKDPSILAVISQRMKENPTQSQMVMRARMNAALPDRSWNALFLLLLEALSEGSPGRLVMWSAYAVAMVRNRKATTVEGMAFQFPHGFPTDAALSKIWDAQKSENGGNLIDQPEFWS